MFSWSDPRPNQDLQDQLDNLSLKLDLLLIEKKIDILCHRASNSSNQWDPIPNQFNSWEPNSCLQHDQGNQYNSWDASSSNQCDQPFISCDYTPPIDCYSSGPPHDSTFNQWAYIDPIHTSSNVPHFEWNPNPCHLDPYTPHQVQIHDYIHPTNDDWSCEAIEEKIRICLREAMNPNGENQSTNGSNFIDHFQEPTNSIHIGSSMGGTYLHNETFDPNPYIPYMSPSFDPPRLESFPDTYLKPQPKIICMDDDDDPVIIVHVNNNILETPCHSDFDISNPIECDMDPPPPFYHELPFEHPCNFSLGDPSIVPFQGHQDDITFGTFEPSISMDQPNQSNPNSGSIEPNKYPLVDPLIISPKSDLNYASFQELEFPILDNSTSILLDPSSSCMSFSWIQDEDHSDMDPTCDPMIDTFSGASCSSYTPCLKPKCDTYLDLDENDLEFLHSLDHDVPPLSYEEEQFIDNLLHDPTLESMCISLPMNLQFIQNFLSSSSIEYILTPSRSFPSHDMIIPSHFLHDYVSNSKFTFGAFFDQVLLIASKFFHYNLIILCWSYKHILGHVECIYNKNIFSIDVSFPFDPGGSFFDIRLAEDVKLSAYWEATQYTPFA